MPMLRHLSQEPFMISNVLIKNAITQMILQVFKMVKVHIVTCQRIASNGSINTLYYMHATREQQGYATRF
jgi:hypothetical protein